jgi:hypothetical protein
MTRKVGEHAEGCTGRHWCEVPTQEGFSISIIEGGGRESGGDLGGKGTDTRTEALSAAADPAAHVKCRALEAVQSDRVRALEAALTEAMAHAARDVLRAEKAEAELAKHAECHKGWGPPEGVIDNWAALLKSAEARVKELEKRQTKQVISSDKRP